jgi:hypothetical protein
MLSAHAHTAVAFAYNDQIGLREAVLFTDGRTVREFGAEDELWVPLGEDGKPAPNVLPLSIGQLVPGEEYETSHNAIDLAFMAAGFAEPTCAEIIQIADQL